MKFSPDRRMCLQGALALLGGTLAPTVGVFSEAEAGAATGRRIDVHHHSAAPEFVAELGSVIAPQTRAWTPARSIEDMDRAGVATAITSVTTPGVWLGDDAQGRRLARISNDYAARLTSQYPGRFGMFAAIPLPDTAGSLREIEYGLDQVHADGIAVFTSYRDRWLGHPDFDPVMEELNRRKAVVYTHPDSPLCCRNLFPGMFNDAVIEYSADTTRAIASLLFSGTAARFPDIRWIFSHGGGAMPFLVERLTGVAANSAAMADRVPGGVLAALRRFHYDIAQAAHPSALAALTKTIPVSQILWGTDYPFRHAGEYVRQLHDHGFSARDLRRIERDNAMALLPRWARPSSAAASG